MPIKIRFPLLNPLRFVCATEQESVTNRYYVDSLPSFERQTNYCTPFKWGDRIRFQFDVSDSVYNIPDIAITLRSTKREWISYNFNPDYSWTNGDFKSLNWSLITPSIQPISGERFYIQIEVPYLSVYSQYGTDVYYSEPINIQQTHPDTVLIRYSNTGIDKGIFFYRTGVGQVYFNYRVKGGFKSDGFTPESIDSIYYGQTHNAELLSSIPFVTKILTIGDNFGVSNYVIDNINRILGCDLVYIDGVQHCKVEGAKFEKTFGTLYPKGIWTISLIESENKETNDYLTTISGINSVNTFPGDLTIINFFDGIVRITPAEPIINHLFLVISRFDDSTFVSQSLPLISVGGVQFESYVGQLPPGDYSYDIIYAQNR